MSCSPAMVNALTCQSYGASLRSSHSFSFTGALAMSQQVTPQLGLALLTILLMHSPTASQRLPQLGSTPWSQLDGERGS